MDIADIRNHEIVKWEREKQCGELIEKINIDNIQGYLSNKKARRNMSKSMNDVKMIKTLQKKK